MILFIYLLYYINDKKVTRRLNKIVKLIRTKNLTIHDFGCGCKVFLCTKKALAFKNECFSSYL
ncbi:hypothetical protein LM7422_140379 [Listeria monocytogenes]|nr:hypothetical protein LM7421_160374 [Listeria monocytogenes]CUL43315.1 hypothetical protein LM7422_140379 [Listeria monocytogenes]